MKKLAALVIFVASATTASAQNYYGQSYGTGSNPNSHYVQPHSNSNGTYTSGHYQTNPNQSRSDNYGSYGNYNPNNGSYGTRR